MNTESIVLGREEGVNLIPHPGGRCLRDRRPDRPPKRPVRSRVALRSLRVRRTRSLIDPGAERFHLLGRKRRPLGRHSQGQIGLGDALDQLTLGRVSGLDRRAALAPFLEQIGGVDSQTGLLLEGSMAGIAAFFEDRLDLPAVIDRLACRNAPATQINASPSGLPAER